MTAVFVLQAVQVWLGTHQPVAALRDIDLHVSAGERVALVGANGSGKSTLLRVLMGLVPVRGRLERARVRTAMVFQRPYLMRLSTLHNVAVGLWLQGARWSQACAAARSALERVGLAVLADRPARALSGGQQQRLALARAWAQRPDVWLLDEPTASLDPQARQEVEALIEAFAAETGATVVFSSHHLGQVRRLATRVVYLENGSIRADLPVETFFDMERLAVCSPPAHVFVREELPWVR